MARAAQRIGSLRDRVSIERRAALTGGFESVAWDEGDELQYDDGGAIQWDEEVFGDGRGNTLGDWFALGSRRCEIREVRGDEVVLSAKLQGRAVCLVIMRVDDLTRTIGADCRLVDTASGRVLNVRYAPPPGRDRFLSLLCEAGVAEG